VNDTAASLVIFTDNVLTLFIVGRPNGSPVWLQVVDEVSGTVSAVHE